MRRYIIILLFVSIFFSGCKNTSKEKLEMTQEEFQLKYLEMLDNMGVLANENTRSPKIFIKENIYIRETDLKATLHIYAWLGDNKGTLPSVEEILLEDEAVSLYSNYDEKTLGKFEKLYEWYTKNGGEKLCEIYSSGIYDAYLLYLNNTGNEINNKTIPSQLTFEDYLDLESYMKGNPNCDNASKNYIQLLEWLGVERPEEKSEESSNKG